MFDPVDADLTMMMEDPDFLFYNYIDDVLPSISPVPVPSTSTSQTIQPASSLRESVQTLRSCMNTRWQSQSAAHFDTDINTNASLKSCQLFTQLISINGLPIEYPSCFNIKGKKNYFCKIEFNKEHHVSQFNNPIASKELPNQNISMNNNSSQIFSNEIDEYFGLSKLKLTLYYKYYWSGEIEVGKKFIDLAYLFTLQNKHEQHKKSKIFLDWLQSDWYIDAHIPIRTNIKLKLGKKRHSNNSWLLSAKSAALSSSNRHKPHHHHASSSGSGGANTSNGSGSSSRSSITECLYGNTNLCTGMLPSRTGSEVSIAIPVDNSFPSHSSHDGIDVSVHLRFRFIFLHRLMNNSLKSKFSNQKQDHEHHQSPLTIADTAPPSDRCLPFVKKHYWFISDPPPDETVGPVDHFQSTLLHTTSTESLHQDQHLSELHVLVATAPEYIVTEVLQHLAWKKCLARSLSIRSEPFLYTVLDFALLNGNASVVLNLLQRAGNYCLANYPPHRNCFHTCVVGGSIQCLTYLIRFVRKFESNSRRHPTTAPVNTNYSFDATSGGNWCPSLRSLLEHRDSLDLTPLALGCSFIEPHREALINLLLSSGASPCSINRFTKYTPLMYTCESGCLRTVQRLLSVQRSPKELDEIILNNAPSSAGPDRLHNTSPGPSDHTAQGYISRDFQAPSRRGPPPFNDTLHNRHESQGNPDLESPLLPNHHSHLHGSHALRNHLRTNARSRNLLKSGDWSHEGYLNPLAVYSCNPSHKDHSGRQAIHIAIEHKQLEILQLLLNIGIACIETDDRGWNAFHTAVHFQCYEALTLLLEAEKHQWTTYKKLLTSCGMQTMYLRRKAMWMLDNGGKTPIDMAFDQQRFAAVEQMIETSWDIYGYSHLVGKRKASHELISLLQDTTRGWEEDVKPSGDEFCLKKSIQMYLWSQRTTKLIETKGGEGEVIPVEGTMRYLDSSFRNDFKKNPNDWLDYKIDEKEEEGPNTKLKEFKESHQLSSFDQVLRPHPTCEAKQSERWTALHEDYLPVTTVSQRGQGGVLSEEERWVLQLEEEEDFYYSLLSMPKYRTEDTTTTMMMMTSDTTFVGREGHQDRGCHGMIHLFVGYQQQQVMGLLLTSDSS